MARAGRELWQAWSLQSYKKLKSFENRGARCESFQKWEETSILQQESQDQANEVATYSQRFVRGNIITSGDSQANSIVLSSSDSDEELSIGSTESDFVNIDDDNEVDVIPTTQLPGLTSTAPVVSTALSTASKAKKTRQRKHWNQLLPPRSTAPRSSRPTAKQESQDRRASEKQAKAKAKSKATSQLNQSDDDEFGYDREFDLPFRSSQW
jgi:hypothetical protein